MTDSTISTERTSNEPEPSDSLKAFGAAHKAFRRRAGYTQEQYAPLVQYQPGTVASIEQGRRGGFRLGCSSSARRKSWTRSVC